MATKRPRFVLRTIKDGKVTINGRIFSPKEREHETSIPYDGRLDGQRWAFGLYYGPPNYETYDTNGWQTRFVSMWGSEETYKSNNVDEPVGWPGANCVNNYFQWEWWHAI